VNLARFLPWQGDNLVTGNWLLKVLLPQNGRITLLFFVRRNLLRCNEVAGGSGGRAGSMKSMSMEKDDLGRYVVELNESAAIIVEQIEDEITVVIASVVGVNFQVTAAQALELSRALAAAAASVMPSTAS